MAKYYPVWPKYWRGDRRRWSDDLKLLGLYLLTCEHRNLEGLYFLPKAYVAADLRWDAEKVDSTIEALEAAGFCAYDERAEVVLVPNALAHQAPSTERQITGAVRSLQAVPDTTLWDAFLEACETHAPALAGAIRNGTGKASETHSGPIGNGSTHARAHTSTSTSTSSTPQPPQGGGAVGLTPPKGKGQRARARFEGEVAATAERLFPGADVRKARRCVRQATERLSQDGTKADDAAVTAFAAQWWPELVGKGAAA